MLQLPAVSLSPSTWVRLCWRACTPLLALREFQYPRTEGIHLPPPLPPLCLTPALPAPPTHCACSSYFSYQTFSFDFSATPTLASVTVVVENLTPGGNVDVFVGAQSAIQCPTSTLYNLSSTNAPPLPQVITITNTPAAGSVWTIGVTSFVGGINDLFSITVYDPTAYLLLAAGTPVYGAVGSPGNTVSLTTTAYYTTSFSVTVRAPPPRFYFALPQAYSLTHHCPPYPTPPHLSPPLRPSAWTFTAMVAPLTSA